MAEKCPVCLSVAERGRDQDYGDKKQFRCPRCGPFEISRTALAMLRSRVENDHLARARLSHSIRSNTSEKNGLFVSSANLDELAHRPLPGIMQQLALLAHWLAAQLGDNRFGRIGAPVSDHLAGILGAVDGEGVGRLISYAENQGIVDRSGKDDGLGLTPRGWAMAEPLERQEVTEKLEGVASAPEIVKAHCDECGGERKVYKRASHSVKGNDEEVSWSDTYDVLECCGCGSIYVRREFWFSEWDDFEDDPITGEPRHIPGIKVTFWPPPTKRKKPDWADNLEDNVLRKVVDEVYQALNAGLTILASVGTRTLLDRAMFMRVGDPEGGFVGKLNEMVRKGHIGRDEKGILEAITDAGSAAAHRGFAPSATMLGTIVETVENFLHREFVLKTAAGEVRKATPTRAKAAKKKKR